MFEEAQLYSPVTRPTTARSRSTWPTTHPGRRTTPPTASAATRSPPPRWPGRQGEPAAADRLHRGRAGGLAHGLARARAEARALRLPRVPRRGRGARPAARPRSRSSTRSRPTAAADRLPLRARRRASCRSTSSTARSPTARFHSTQYIRHHDAPLYTPEPDLIHEVIGHGHLLADPQFAELNRLAGEAARRVETPDGAADGRRRLLVHDRVRRRARGRRAARLRRRHPLLLRRDRGVPRRWRSARSTSPAMATLEYDITKYQPVLFAADSMDHLVDAVGGFFAALDDDTPLRLSADGAARTSSSHEVTMPIAAFRPEAQPWRP